MYSLIKTARANECEPYSYPIHIFEQLPRVGSLSACEALLHWNVERVKIIQAGFATRG